MHRFLCGLLLASASWLAVEDAHAEITRTIGQDDKVHLSFTATGSVAIETRDPFSRLNGTTNAGYERLRFQSTFRAQLAYADIGDPFWSEVNVTGQMTLVENLDDGAFDRSFFFGNRKDASYGAFNVVLGTGATYAFAANGGVTAHGPGAGHTGSFPRSAAGTGFYDTFQRIHGNTGGRDDDVILAGDASGILNFVSEDQGGTNSEIFLGAGYVTKDAHYGLQASSNGEFVALSLGQKLTPEIGVNAVVYKVASTNRNGRAVDDRGFDVFLTHVTNKAEYGLRLTGWGYGPSPTWNAEKRTRLRFSSSHAITDRHAVGFNIDYEDFPVINATTAAPIREQVVKRLTVMYGYQLNQYSFLTAQAVRTDTDVISGSLDGTTQRISQIRLAYNFIF